MTQSGHAVFLESQHPAFSLLWLGDLTGLVGLSPGFLCILETPGFFLKFPGPGNSWKLKFKVLKSPGIYLWFNLTIMPKVYV